MVVGQIALSLMLLAAGGLFARGALKAAAANPGLQLRPAAARRDRSGSSCSTTRRAGAPAIATCSRACARCPASRRSAWRRRCRSASSTKGTRSSASAVRRARIWRRASNATYRVIGGDYFRALNLPMVRGREFTEAEETSRDGAAGRDRRRAPRAAAVRRRRSDRPDDPLLAAARARPTKNNGEPMEIVGIAAPIRDDLFDREAGPAFYEPWGRNYRGNMFLHVRAAQRGNGGGAARRRSAARSAPTIPSCRCCRRRR